MSANSNLLDDDDHVQVVGEVNPMPNSATNDGGGATDASTASAADAARMLIFPSRREVKDDKYLRLRAVLAGEILRRKIHVIVSQRARSAAWNTFYQDCFAANGVMSKFGWLKTKSPAYDFRTIIYAGVEFDSEKYKTCGDNGKEPSELEILLNIIVLERDMADDAHTVALAAKKKKDEEVRSENEAAEVQLGLRSAPGLITPSPAGNPTSVFGGETSRAGEYSVVIYIAHQSYF